MYRKLLIGSAALLLLATDAAPASAQGQRQGQQGWRRAEMERLHHLCDQNYKPACIRFGIMIGENRNRHQQWKHDHPTWWWWERW